MSDINLLQLLNWRRQTPQVFLGLWSGDEEIKQLLFSELNPNHRSQYSVLKLTLYLRGSNTLASLCFSMSVVWPAARPTEASWKSEHGVFVKCFFFIPQTFPLLNHLKASQVGGTQTLHWLLRKFRVEKSSPEIITVENILWRSPVEPLNSPSSAFTYRDVLTTYSSHSAVVCAADFTPLQLFILDPELFIPSEIDRSAR